MSSIVRDRSEFKFGPYIPIIWSDQRVIIDANGVVDYYHETDLVAKKFLSEILPDDSIVEAPSMVVPLLLKKKTFWPRLETQDVSNSDLERDMNILNGSDDDEDIQLVKIIDRRESKCDLIPRRLMPTKDYVRSSLVQKMSNNLGTTLAISDFYKSSASDLLLSIGLSQVREFVLEDKYKRLASKVRRGYTGLVDQAGSVRQEMIQAKLWNRPYKLNQIYRCPHCPFKAELKSILEKHLQIPHKNKSRIFICNWCSFKSKDKSQIIYHSYMVHNKRSYFVKPVPTHCCRYCDFESNSKAKFTQHMDRCERYFDPHNVQSPVSPNDYPAVTPKFITQEDIRAYEVVLKELRLAAYNPHQIEVSAHESQSSVYLVPRGAISLRPQGPQQSATSLSSPFTNNPSSFTTSSSSTSASTPNQLHQIAHALMSNSAAPNSMPNNRGATLQHPKPPSAFSNGIFLVKNTENVVMAPSQKTADIGQRIASDPSIRARKSITHIQHQASMSTPVDQEEELEVDERSSDSFVICELCDIYIEGFSEFKFHMFEVHQVKIQRKLPSRPPLNCQKCQWRFYTDLGLERHLLGSHGLVTTSMQDKVDKQMDSGRCTICGRKFAKKLVTHMRESHKISLKPAQLSYKCKVCSATYGLYCHFENHISKVHPDL